MTPEATSSDDHVFLIGRPPIGEFIGFIQTMAVNGQTVDRGLLAEEWRRANDHLIGLEKAEAGIADGVTSAPLPSLLKDVAERVRAQPSFAQTFQFVPVEFGMVELDRLVVYQKFINLSFIGFLKSTVSEKPSEIDIAKVAFSIDQPLPPVHQMQTAPNAFSFLCASNDFRVLDTSLLPPQQVLAPSGGRPVAHLAVGVGFGINLLNVVSAEGRLILNNGSHRAYFLRESGITHVPCVIQRVTRRDELEFIGGDLQQNPDRYLKAPRPPILKDYFDPALRKVVAVTKKNRSVRVQFGYEQGDVPA